MWDIEKIVSKGEYNYAVVREHPRATRHGYVLEHRIVMENHLGRLLGGDEVVHHKDNDKKNNTIENLALMSSVEHAELHGRQQGKWFVDMVCPVCSTEFTRARHVSHLCIRSKKKDTCSRRCGGISSHMEGLTTTVLREYKSYRGC